MKGHGKWLKILVVFILVINFCGCWNSRELENLAIVMGIGIDKAQQKDEIAMTAQIIIPSAIGTSTSKGGGNNSPAYFNVTDTNESVLGALRDMTHQVNKKLYNAHAQVLIVGKEQAEAGMQVCLDKFLRNHEDRLSMPILVAQGKASDILDTKSDLDPIPAVNIALLLQDQSATSESMPVRLIDFLNRQLSPTTSPVVPLLSIITVGDKKEAKISGMGVFKNDKLIGELTNKESRGLLWVLGKIKSGVININAPGGRAQLEIIKASSEMKTKIRKDGSIEISIIINEEGGIQGKTTKADLSKLDVVKELEKNAEEEIKQEIFNTFEKSKIIGADIFGIGDEINERHSKLFKKLEKKWDQIYQTLEINVQVNVKLNGSGRLARSPYPEKE